MLPDMGQTEKEIRESHEWAAEPVAVDNKQSNKYNKDVSQQIAPNMVSFLLLYYIFMP